MIISWDEYFMGMAELSALRSKDPHSQVGACIVNREKKIVGLGYNGFPKGCKDTEFPWEKNYEDVLKSKFTYVVHAEANAILNSAVNDLAGATIYVNRFPCNECAKLIIQKGIKEVVYCVDKHPDRASTIAAKRMFEASGVTTRQIEPVQIIFKRKT